MAAFVLVHGGCHGAWCYSRVLARLLSVGHEVYTPTLSGVGELAHLAGQAINLSTHIEDVVATIIDNDLTGVILCGHSYSLAFQANASDIDWVDRMCTPHPIGCFSQKLGDIGGIRGVSTNPRPVQAV